MNSNNYKGSNEQHQLEKTKGITNQNKDKDQ